MRIAIVNQSTIASDAELRLIVSALDVQANHHLRPIWRISPVILDFVRQGERTEPGAWELLITDTSDVARALGYHTDEGEPRGFVFARTCQEAGATLSVTISHELLEMLGDPDTTRTHTYGGAKYAVELCDPCEADQWGYRIGDVLVSDFITPEWFGAPKSGASYDYARLIDRPRKLLRGGYCLEYTRAQGWHQVYASERGRESRSLDQLVTRPGTSDRTMRRLEELEVVHA